MSDQHRGEIQEVRVAYDHEVKRLKNVYDQSIEKHHREYSKKLKEREKWLETLRTAVLEGSESNASLRSQLEIQLSEKAKLEKEIRKLKKSVDKNVTFKDNETRQSTKKRDSETSKTLKVGDRDELNTPYLSPWDIAMRSSLQPGNQQSNHSRRTNEPPDGNPGDSDDSSDSDDDAGGNGGRREKKGKDKEKEGEKKEKERKRKEEENKEDERDSSPTSRKSEGTKQRKQRTVQDEEEELTTYQAYYGDSHMDKERDFIIDSLESHNVKKTKHGHHIIAIPTVFSVRGLAKAKLTSVLKDFMGKPNPKKSCKAGSLIERLRDLVVHMANTGISLRCIADCYITFAIEDEEKTLIGPNRNSLMQLLIWIRERAMIEGNPEITIQRCITEAALILKSGKGLGELYTKIISEFVPRIMSSRDGNLIVTKDRTSWMRYEGFELFKNAIREFNTKLYNHIEKGTGWRSDLCIKDMSNKFESWLTVERREADQDKEKFCSLLEFQELRKDIESRLAEISSDSEQESE